jgi:hypothetical protein
VVINGYFINGYCWLLMAILLVVINDYSINHYCWLLMVILLVVIGGIILLMAIGRY